SETVLLGCLATFVECYWPFEVRPPIPVLVFRVALMSLGIAVAHRTFSSGWLFNLGFDTAIRLSVATPSLFLFTSIPGALLEAASENTPFAAVWKVNYLSSMPYYVGGAAIAQIVILADKYVGWQTILLTGPVVYLIYRSYSLYLERLDDERRHA